MKNITETSVYMGQHHFGPLVDITDPCYSRDVWCRINDVPVVEGDYDCQIDILEYDVQYNGAHPEYHERRVSAIQITLSGTSVPEGGWADHGEIGVDAGLAGFFNHKPDYNDEEWSHFCDGIHEGDAWFRPEGFFSSSGYGDGCYGVCAYHNAAGDIIGLRIEFIYLDDEEDDDE